MSKHFGMFLYGISLTAPFSHNFGEMFLSFRANGVREIFLCVYPRVNRVDFRLDSILIREESMKKVVDNFLKFNRFMLYRAQTELCIS